MEVFILLAAGFVAVTNTLALTFDGENISLVAELALADLNPTLVFILISELGCADFNHKQLVVEIMILHSEQGADERLKGLAGELNSRVFFVSSSS